MEMRCVTRYVSSLRNVPPHSEDLERSGNSELRGHLVEVGEQPAGKAAHLLGLTHLDVVEGIE